ncbi:non-homologous end joining protein Ku (plasmid) [Streptomyces sp. SDT5-1]|uniref:non-homologous end joining protein Ku n=1 Tax=Streptomyces sp. SDT5-1 TaxID=3406418 RepID=UPI003FD41DF7
MPRPVWSGAISFGLVTIPIKVATATEDHSIRFHQYHLEDMGRVRTRKICETEGREVSGDEIGKGYEVSRDTIVAVSDEELREIPLPTAKAIEIVAFVPYESVDVIRIADGYYLEADGQVAAKPYALLRQALARNSRAAIAKFAWHGRERLGLLRVVDGAIALHAMKWPDEVRSPHSLAPREVDVTNKEIDEALVLIDSMTYDGPIREAEWATDRYTAALEDVIHAKVDGKKPPQPQTGEEPTGQVVDLMSALEQSVQRAKQSRTDGADADVHELKPKKKAAKKAPAKKATTSSTKKTASMKTASKKSRSA